MSSKQFFCHARMEPPLPGQYEYFSGSKCVFAQGHNRVEVGLEPLTSRSGVGGSTNRPLQSPIMSCVPAAASKVL